MSVNLSNAALGPTLFGTEVLYRIAAERQSAELRWITGNKAYILRFAGGRPAAYVAPNNAVSTEPDTVRKVLRAFAIATEGFIQLVPAEATSPLQIDVQGEALVAVLHGLPEKGANEIISSRGERWFRSSPRFDALAGAIQSSRGPMVTKPAQAVTLKTVVGSASIEAKRAWLVLLALDGLSPSQAPPRPVAPATPAPSQVATSSAPHTAQPSAAQPKRPKPPGGPAPEPGTEAAEKAHLLAIEMPTDPDSVYAALDLKKRLSSMFDKTHYAVLGVSKVATEDEIRGAYFDLAKTYHTDRFSNLDLGGYGEVAREVFRKITEAHELLTNAEERSNYDVYLDRKEKGLPTDVELILESDNLFQRAKVLVSRGNGINAAPLMERAFELNHVDPEYKTYYAYTRYLAQGSESFDEVRGLLEEVIRDHRDLALAYDFLGRIFRAEDKLKQAMSHLAEAVRKNPKNADAQRELRLVQMRVAKQREEESKKGGSFFDKLLKR
ncbi:MAG: J domain-containing protein [Myxococcota bacterium]